MKKGKNSLIKTHRKECGGILRLRYNFPIGFIGIA